MNNLMSNKRPTYLVTGASGFVGGALATKLLRDGNDVVCLLRDGYAPSGARIIRGDLSNYDDCRRAVMKAGAYCRVFHLGAQAKVGYANNNRMETFESNIRGTYNLLEAVERHSPFSPVVVASSDKAYGELDEGYYFEDHPMEGRGFYDVSKSCTDLIARSYAHHGLDVAVVRCGNIYGPTDVDLSRAVPSFARDLVRGQAPVIRSDGTPIRDYLHVLDAVVGYELVMDRLVAEPKRTKGQAYNFSGGEELSVRQLADRMCQVWHRETDWGIKQPIVEGTRCGEIQRQVLNCEKARGELGWKPTVGLDEGLLHTMRWWQTEGR